MTETAKIKLKALNFFYKNVKESKFTVIAIFLVIIASIAGIYLISSNEGQYTKVIANVTRVINNSNSGKNQNLEAVIMNGTHKGEKIELEKSSLTSNAFALQFKPNDEVFISIHEDSNHKITSASVLDFKRDKYLIYSVVMFALLIVLIGGFKGITSLISTILNILIFSATIELLLKGFNPILTAAVASILFIIISVILVSGINKKTTSAIIGTIVGTLISMLLAAVVVKITHTKGIGHQELDYLSTLPSSANFTIEQIFFIEILIGTLGAIIDIAISISSAIKEIYDKNPQIEIKSLIKSGMEIGKDIMGTMANTLIFAYISGSIPIVLILLLNGVPVFGVISYDISLEIIRALTGSIGIVISIPITLYISVMLIKKSQDGRNLLS